MTSQEIIRRTIFRKLLRQDYIGARHTSIENVPKGFPRSEHKNVMKVVQQLIKEGYFLVKPKPDSLRVSLNPKFLVRVIQEVESERT